MSHLELRNLKGLYSNAFSENDEPRQEEVKEEDGVHGKLLSILRYHLLNEVDRR